MFLLFILVTKGTYFDSCSEHNDFFLVLVNVKTKLYVWSQLLIAQPVNVRREGENLWSAL